MVYGHEDKAPFARPNLFPGEDVFAGQDRVDRHRAATHLSYPGVNLGYVTFSNWRSEVDPFGSCQDYRQS